MSENGPYASADGSYHGVVHPQLPKLAGGIVSFATMVLDDSHSAFEDIVGNAHAATNFHESEDVLKAARNGMNR